MTPYTVRPTTKKRIMTQRKTTQMLKTFRKQTATIMMMMMMMMIKMTIRVTMMMEKIKTGIRDENHARKVKMSIVMMTTMILREPRVMMIMMITIEIPVTPEKRIPLQWST